MWNMECKIFIKFVYLELSKVIISSYLEDVCNIPTFSSNLALGTQGGRSALLVEPNPQDQPPTVFGSRLQSADFSKSRFCLDFSPFLGLAMHCLLLQPNGGRSLCVFTSRCLLLFQLWTNPPLTMVSKGCRRLSPGTLVTPSACQRSAQSLLFY